MFGFLSCFKLLFIQYLKRLFTTNLKNFFLEESIAVSTTINTVTNNRRPSYSMTAASYDHKSTVSPASTAMVTFPTSSKPGAHRPSHSPGCMDLSRKASYSYAPPLHTPMETFRPRQVSPVVETVDLSKPRFPVPRMHTPYGLFPSHSAHSPQNHPFVPSWSGTTAAHPAAHPATSANFNLSPRKPTPISVYYAGVLILFLSFVFLLHVNMFVQCIGSHLAYSVSPGRHIYIPE